MDSLIIVLYNHKQLPMQEARKTRQFFFFFLLGKPCVNIKLRIHKSITMHISFIKN